MDVEEEKVTDSDGGEEVTSEAPKQLECAQVVLDIDSHPTLPIVCAALVSGELEIHKQRDGERSDALDNPFKRLARISKLHRGEACRTIGFNQDGTALFTGGADGSLHGIDCSQGKTVWTLLDGFENVAINRVSTCLSGDFGPLALLAADENGTIKLFDCRESPDAPKFAFPPSHVDFVSDFAYSPDDKRVFTTGGDGALSVFDLRKVLRVKREARSLEMETELLSVLRMKNGQKIVCGTNEGPIVIFKQGEYDEPQDNITGHPHSVDSLLKLDEDTMLTGSSDGIIRIVRVSPHKLLGVIGYHDDFPVERMKFSQDKRLVATCSHDNIVRFWETGFLVDGIDDLGAMDLETPANGSGDDDESDAAMNDGNDDEKDSWDNDEDAVSASAASKSKKKLKPKSTKALLTESTAQNKKKKPGPSSEFFEDL